MISTPGLHCTLQLDDTINVHLVHEPSLDSFSNFWSSSNAVNISSLFFFASSALSCKLTKFPSGWIAVFVTIWHQVQSGFSKVLLKYNMAEKQWKLLIFLKYYLIKYCQFWLWSQLCLEVVFHLNELLSCLSKWQPTLINITVLL